MNTFNILKPDALEHEAALSYYFANIITLDGINSIKLYFLDNWTEIASLIYEYDVVKSSEDKIKLRKKLLTSIIGYYHVYTKNIGIVVFFDIADDSIYSTLQKLHLLKKNVRKDFVNNNDLYYLKFLNQDNTIFNNPLYNISLSELQVDIKRFPSNAPYNNPEYNMIFFNHIHGPDPNSLEEIEHNLKILHDANVIHEEKLIKVLKK